MKTVKFTAVWVSENNPKFAILAPIVEIKVGNKTLISRGQGGFLESDTPWTKGESIDLPVGMYKISERKTKLGTTLPVIEIGQVSTQQMVEQVADEMVA